MSREFIPYVKSIFDDFLHLFFPHLCPGCASDVISRDSVLCVQCLYELPVTNFHLHAGNQVEKIFWGRVPVNSASSFCYFTKDSLIQNLLHHLKYKGKKNLGLFLGKMLGETLVQAGRFQDIDALVPLPLFPAREKRRGYNQADVLCQGISAVMHLPVYNDVVRRVSSTETQTHKSRVERWQNMEGRFLLTNKNGIKNKHLLLVDDVVTTGASLEACSAELLTAQNVQVSIATLAYTVR